MGIEGKQTKRTVSSFSSTTSVKASRFSLRHLVWVAALAWVTTAVAQPVRGPFWSGTIMLGKDKPAAMKGLAVTLGADQRAYVVYDLDTLRMAAAWTGEFLEFGNTLTKIEWPPPPSVKGRLVFSTANGPGWAGPEGTFADPRPAAQGPLPKDWAHYSGVYVHGDQVVLSYTVGDVPVLETPGVQSIGGQMVFTRTLNFDRTGHRFSLLLADGFDPKAIQSSSIFAAEGVTFTRSDGSRLSVSVSGVSKPGLFGRGGTEATLTTTSEGRLVLKIDRIPAGDPLQIALSNGGTAAVIAARNPDPPAPQRLTGGGPARWTETMVTQGKLGTEDGPYAVDTLTEPFPNPYQVSTFFGGFDFLPDGRAAICSFHGDVWLVSGIDEKLEKLTWKRYATGLFQPLGLKVVNGEIYVAGRDQITRLKDLNGDGEADFYENFNNDTVVTPNYHEFVLDLHTDSQGNFYYAKGAPWEPLVTSPHQGTILKVSPDGKKLEVFATGLRAPNGMTVGPDDTILVGDNQGHWMPASKLNRVKPGSFMGMVPAAQQELTLRYPDGREIKVNPSDPAARAQYQLKGWDKEMPIPTSYDEPICWLPMRWDNSSGGQVFVTSDRWGPWKGAPLFMSYGKCLLYAVLWDQVGDTVQASMVPFGLKFASGIMRGRFHERDGQLYLCGLKGWQNSATRDGGFYRVRYTGRPVQMPVKARAARNGLQITFSTELDPKTAGDSSSYSVELWNYTYSGNYGSPEFSVKDPTKQSHDRLEVKSARLGADRRTVFLEIPDLTTADQYSLKYALETSDGTELRSEIIGTLHELGPELSPRSGDDGGE